MDEQSAQAVIAPLATLLTVFLWLETWLEILTRGGYHSPDDLSKLYLAVMAAYAGAAEITKWLVAAPTDPQEDPMFERIHRGGFFVWLWLAPLLFAYGWRITNHAIPMPEPLMKITIGLVGIFFLKAASRKLRHKQHGVLGADVEGTAAGSADEPPEVEFTEAVHAKIASARAGLSSSDLLAAVPDVSKPRLYRALDKLVKARRIIRTGQPRTPDVRYRARAAA